MGTASSKICGGGGAAARRRGATSPRRGVVRDRSRGHRRVARGGAGGMIIVGLTGSIGMGKSTAAGLLRRLGIPVYDADRAVHRLLRRGGRAVPAVALRFPEIVRDGAVDRPALGRIVFADRAALAALEAIIHPLVFEAQKRFLHIHALRRTKLVVLDIPLLFEAGGYRRCAATLVVS